MRMIPDTPHGTHSQAEKRVFDLLRMAFADAPENGCTAYHSLNLNSHAYKRFGEIDFLIFGPVGIFVLEVKGGNVSCQQGVWRYRDRHGAITESVEGPFRQAESALHGLMHTLRARLPAGIVEQFSIGYGVIFPDCEWRQSGAEWDDRTLADNRRYKDLERWLLQLFAYWRAKDGGQRTPSAAALQEVSHYLRPEFEAVVPLHVEVGQAGECIARLTEDQMVMVDVAAANPRVLCSGGAGTGKTFLALELARRWAARHENVLLLCRSSWLRHFLAAAFSIPGLTVSQPAALSNTMRRQQLRGFDALIVDEGQDLFDMDSLRLMDGVLQGGLSNGRWCIFHDSNNQSGLCGAFELAAIDHLNSLQPAQIPLRTNCRNTRLILNKVQQSLGADMGIKGAGSGPQVREYHAASEEESARLLAAELAELIEHGGLPPGEVTLLSPLAFETSSLRLLPAQIRREIVQIDDYSLRNFPPQKTNFAEIANFKGLENEAIIVIDLPPPGSDSPLRALHYVAMSRARSVLSLIQLQGR